MQLPGGDIACAFGGSDDDDLSAIWRVLKQNSRIRVEPGVPPRSRALPGGTRWGVVTVRRHFKCFTTEFCFVCSPALTGVVRTGLSGRERQVDRNPTFRTGAKPACNPLLGTRGGAGVPEHYRSEADS